MASSGSRQLPPSLGPGCGSRFAGSCIGRAVRRGETGAVLLEVILALVLFVGAAAVLSGGLSSSLDSLDRLRLQAHAADLAVSVLSELQMGTKSAAAGGVQPFPTPLESWTWEVVPTPLETESGEKSSFVKVEVVIRHDTPSYTFRLTQVIQPREAPAGAGERRPGVSSF